MIKGIKFPLRITEYPDMEGACKDHWVQLLTPHKRIYKLDFSPKSTVQMLLEHRETWGHNHVLGVGFFSALFPNLYHTLKTVTDTLN